MKLLFFFYEFGGEVEVGFFEPGLFGFDGAGRVNDVGGVFEFDVGIDFEFGFLWGRGRGGGGGGGRMGNGFDDGVSFFS